MLPASARDHRGARPPPHRAAEAVEFDRGREREPPQPPGIVIWFCSRQRWELKDLKKKTRTRFDKEKTEDLSKKERKYANDQEKSK